MRKVLIILSSLTLTLTIIVAWVMLDGYRVYRFRTSQDEIAIQSGVDLTGLRDLHLSGSNQIVFRDLYRKLENVNMPIYILDVSNNSAGYIREFTADFFGYPKSTSLKHYIRRLLIIGRFKINKSDLRSEAEVAGIYGFHYFHIPLNARTIPTDEFVDKFVAAVENIPHQAWIHTYCQSGRGRTSLAMVMVDIIKNHDLVALEDILKRQYLLGSQDLSDTSLWRNGTYTQQMLDDRKAFIIRFYHFLKQRHSGGSRSWVEWNAAGN
ncbi:hypothetical protein [Candidatus Paracaedibacter symbiosus]|uniref:hypothetical protein n=1 Tax=Candidatus Paracaedibacter symbiosus TaxID=244582 RepID=UPI000509A92F|nr:hypothetical protein [Candidatus Paracaedibacter symbiosus]